MWRDLYRQAIDPEAFFDNAYLRSLMTAVSGGQQPATGADLATTVQELARWSEQQGSAFTELLRVDADDNSRPHALRTMLIQSAPMASSLGCPLQGLSAPGVFEDEVQLKAMALLADDCGVGTPLSSRNDEYRLLLNGCGLTEFAVPAHELPSAIEITDDMYALPAVLHALSRRSDAWGFELVGIDRAFRALGTLPVWTALQGYRPSAIDWAKLDLGRPTGAGGVADPAELSAQIAQACSRLGTVEAGRVAAGASWFAAAVRRCHDGVLLASRAALDPEQAMYALVRARAREASVYHQDFPLEGRPLADWLRESLHDPAPLVQALGRSKLVKPGDSARSSLVNGLVNVRGPMFRIFSPHDLSVLRRWIDQLPAQRQHSEPVPPTGYLPPPAAPAAPAEQAVNPADLREAYYVLQGRALAPQARAFAVDYVRNWLEQTRERLGNSARSLPAEWSAQGLRPWLLDQHDKHADEFAGSDATDMPSREDIIDSTVQLAPLTLIDGAWLQGFTDVNLASSRIGAPLFQTYWDELGNGQLALNHPKMYRDGLRQMGVELPPTGSREFAQDQRIREESLRLPVYWLCIGKLPVTFLPEILGMNLAMELSGVGGSYRSARRFLKHYGFSTRFVDIHNTIDNVSTGHSAWAADAIDIYMRSRVDQSDPREHSRIWDRVRLGYESLSPVPAKKSGGLFASRRRRRPSALPQTGDLSRVLLHHTPIRISA